MESASCTLHAQLDYAVTRQTERLDDHEQRLRYLEKAHWRMTAIVSVCSAIAAAIGSIIVACITNL